MRITEIKRKENTLSVYEVTFQPNWLEKLFGVVEKQKEYRNSGSTYSFGGGTVYIDKDGNYLSNGSYIGESIDKWRRQF